VEIGDPQLELVVEPVEDPVPGRLEDERGTGQPSDPEPVVLVTE
jgi:hypothetical protein